MNLPVSAASGKGRQAKMRNASSPRHSAKIKKVPQIESDTLRNPCDRFKYETILSDAKIKSGLVGFEIVLAVKFINSSSGID